MTQPGSGGRPMEGEAPFSISEIFFSRTDPRGVIASGNQVFRRVADFDWPQLIGAPHRLIRHPDMPRGVFQLFWDRLGRGEFVAAYVKNLARDGLHYWVFAVATPIAGGFLSVRIKPTSTLFEAAEQLYAKLLAREEAEKLAPEESAAALLAELATLGFPDYDTFMAAAMVAESRARSAALGNGFDGIQDVLTDLAKQSAKLAAESEALKAQFNAIRNVPINLGIAAMGLGDDGRPIAVIAENYAMMCREIFAKLAELRSDDAVGFSAIALAANRAQVLNCTAVLQEEVAAAFAAETGESPVDRDAEIQRLNDQTAALRDRATDSLRGVRTEVAALTALFNDLGRLVSGLDVTRVLCRVEGGRLPPARASALLGIISSLDSFHAALSERLDRLNTLTDEIGNTALRLGADDRRKVRRKAA